jgi:hypothetical protein
MIFYIIKLVQFSIKSYVCKNSCYNFVFIFVLGKTIVSIILSTSSALAYGYLWHENKMLYSILSFVSNPFQIDCSNHLILLRVSLNKPTTITFKLYYVIVTNTSVV